MNKLPIFAPHTLHHELPLSDLQKDSSPPSTSIDSNNRVTTKQHNAIVDLLKGNDTDKLPSKAMATKFANVADYGAKGDGVTNDRQSFLDAIAALTSGGLVQGTLYIPKPSSKYIWDAQISISDANGLRIVGEGTGHSNPIAYRPVTEIKCSGYSGAGYHLNFIRPRNVVIKDLMFTGQGIDDATLTGGIKFDRDTNGNIPNIMLEDVEIYDVGNEGIYVKDAIITSTFNRVTVRKSKGHGFHIDDATAVGSTSLTMINCYGLSGYKSGLQLETVNYSALVGCGSESNGLGYRFINSNSTSLLSCGAEGMVDRTAQSGSPYAGDSYYFDSGNIVMVGCYSLNPATLVHVNQQGTAAVTFIEMRQNDGTNGNKIKTQLEVADDFQIKKSGGGNILPILNRGATSNFSSIKWQTNSLDRWRIGQINDSTENFVIRELGNSRDYMIFNYSNQEIVQKTKNSSPTDGDLFAGSISFYLDEAGNNLKVRVKYADGTTLKTGTLAIV